MPLKRPLPPARPTRARPAIARPPSRRHTAQLPKMAKRPSPPPPPPPSKARPKASERRLAGAMGVFAEPEANKTIVAREQRQQFHRQHGISRAHHGFEELFVTQGRLRYPVHVAELLVDDIGRIRVVGQRADDGGEPSGQGQHAGTFGAGQTARRRSRGRGGLNQAVEDSHGRLDRAHRSCSSPSNVASMPVIV